MRRIFFLLDLTLSQNYHLSLCNQFSITLVLPLLTENLAK